MPNFFRLKKRKKEYDLEEERNKHFPVEQIREEVDEEMAEGSPSYAGKETFSLP